MSIKRFGLVLCLTCWMGLSDFALGPAKGGSLLVYDSGNTETSKPGASPWLVTWTDPGVNLAITASAGGANSQSKQLTLKYQFTGAALTPVSLVFTEDGVASSSYGGKSADPTDGLNFKLTEQLTNGTNIPIKMFTETLTDSDMAPNPLSTQNPKTLTRATVPTAAGSDHHPSQSHFHSINGPYTPFSLLTPLDQLNGGQLAVLGRGMLSKGDAATNINFKIHDIVVSNYERQFTLTITPSGAAANPEPASFVLMGIGVAGALGYSWRRRKSATARASRT